MGNEGLLLLGAGTLALVLLGGKKASAQDAPTPPPTPKPKPKPAPDDDDGGGDDDDGGGSGGGGGGTTPTKPTPPAPVDEGEPLEERPVTAKLETLDADERAAAIAAARKAAEREKAEAARPAPTVDDKGNLEIDQEPPPTESSHAAPPPSGMVTAPIVSMPAEKPSLPAGVDLAAAKRMAANVAANIRSKKTAYDRKQLASFQQKAGLTGDGLYGPISVSALKYFGVSSPPAALFKGGPIKTYTPPA